MHLQTPANKGPGRLKGPAPAAGRTSRTNPACLGPSVPRLAGNYAIGRAIQAKMEAGQPEGQGAGDATDVQLKCRECEKEELQAKAESGLIQASPEVERGIEGSKGQGRPLPPSLGGELDARMGTDFGCVRIHDDANAARMSRGLGAQAFTHGTDISFNQGKYNPSSLPGQAPASS